MHFRPMRTIRAAALWHWLAEARHFWITIAVIAVALYLSLRPGASEPVIRWTGGVLQLLGVITVVWGIAETRAFFGHAPILSVASRWLGRFPLVRQNVVVGVGIAEGISAVGRARGYVTAGAGANPTVEDRVAALERNIGHLNDRINETFKEMDAGFQEVKGALSDEKEARVAEDKRTREMLETTATGGVHISAMGAAWLFVGVILSTAAIEIERWLKVW